MDNSFWLGLALGYWAGASVMWFYFARQGLIRSRSEWYRYRKFLGYKVPDNWQEDYPE